MKIKTIITAILFFFIGVSLTYLYIDSKKDKEKSVLISEMALPDSSSANKTIETAADSQHVSVSITEKNKIDENTAKEPAEKSKTSGKIKNVDYVYYFMTSARCPSCMKIEAYTKEAVHENFGNSLKKGSLKWEMISVDTAGNEHFVKDYGLYTKSVVLVKMRDGKQVSWKNLDQVWSLLGDKIAFKKYITDEITSFTGKS